MQTSIGEVIKTTPGFNEKFWDKLEQYQAALNSPPPPEEILISEITGFPYMSIETIENLLDTMFYGLWRTTDFHYSIETDASGQKHVIADCIVGYFHAIKNEWIWKVGSTSVAIIENKIEVEEGRFVDWGLAAAMPAVLSMCVKDGAQRIGKRFGRSIRRTDVEDYIPMNKANIEAYTGSKEFQTLITTIKGYETYKDVQEGFTAIKEALPNLEENEQKLINEFLKNRGLKLKENDTEAEKGEDKTEVE